MIWNGCTITEERLEVIDFTSHYMNNKQIVVVLKDSPYQTFEDLAGKKMAIQEGSRARKKLDANKEFKDSLKEVVRSATTRRRSWTWTGESVDCVAVDIVVFNYYIAKEGTDSTACWTPRWVTNSTASGVRKDDDAFRPSKKRSTRCMRTEPPPRSA